MTIASGSRLGPYEIVSRIGAGGMGEVWRARDSRLERDVAIKVLPASLAHDPQFRLRFEREAKAISQLNHPHICQIYDVGDATNEQTAYLVMELLEGETLAERIGRGALPLSDVLRYGVQIADALAAAHRAGIVHRDLKPGNVMLTRSGAKLLDFGLAKLQFSRLASDPSALTERHDPLTAQGVIVGTIPYMSPEQLQGKALDHRTDIFSLGVILYEMTTGRRPFPGNTGEAVLAGILSSDPEAIHSLQPSAPPALGQIIVTALEKDPEQRWQTAHDVARQLRWIGETGWTGQRPAVAPRRIVSAWPLALGVALAALLTFAATRYFSSSDEKRPMLRLHLAPPPGMQFLSRIETNMFSISPDGQTLCFSALSGNASALFLRRLDSTEVTKIEGTNLASGPFWSANGEWIGFSARGKLWKTKISGGAPEAICDVDSGVVATWVGSTILFADGPGGRKEIFRVSAQGGTPTPVTTIAAGEWRHAWPQLLPDGEHFVYQSFAITSIDHKLILASLKSTSRSELLRNISRATPVGADKLVYVREGTLLMQRFDLSKGVTVGDPSALGANVFYFYPTAGADFSASQNGTVVYRTTAVRGRLVLRDRNGLETKVLDEKGPFLGSHSVSPDGRKAAVSVKSLANGYADIWIYDLARSLRDRITSEPGMEVFPVWSPDGRSIVYSHAQGGTVLHLVRRSLAGSQPEELAPRGTFQIASSFSPDGLNVYYSSTTSRNNRDLFRLSIKTKIAEAVLSTSSYDAEPEVSPDGRWMAYSSSSGGTPEITCTT